MTKKYDLTQGGILKKLLLVAVPIMGTQLMQMAYNLTDMFWLGRLSSDAVAATGTAGMFMWLSMGFMMIGRMGSEIGVSQNLGRNDPDTAKKFSQTALLMGLVLGLLYGFAAIGLSRPMISVFGIQESNVVDAGASYLRIVGIGCPITFVSAAITGTFNGSGNSRLSFLANASGLVINMILDPLLIFVAKMDVFGAAVATVTAQAAVLVIFLVAIKKSKGRPFPEYRFFIKPRAADIRLIIKWSLPIACESMFFTLLSMMTTRFVSPFGADAIATQRVGTQIESLSWLIGGGFGSAVTAFTGQNFGAGMWNRIHRGFRISAVSMVIWGIIVTATLYFLGGQLFYLFLPDDGVFEMGQTFMRILVITQIMTCLEGISAGYFRGMGKSLPPSVISIAANVIRVPMAYLLGQTSLGIYGIWLGVSLGSFIRGAAIFSWCLIDARKRPKEDRKIAALQN